MSTDPAAFGPLLRTLRLRAGLSQYRLALDAGAEQSTVLKIERGDRHPSRSMCFAFGNAMAPALEVDPGSLGDTLAVRAGHLPRDLAGYVYRQEPEVAELAALLRDEAVPAAVRADARATVRLMLAIAGLAAHERERAADD